MQNDSIFALTIGVGKYEKMGVSNLPTYSNDLDIIKNGLMLGLRVPEDHIRALNGKNDNGYVTTRDLAYAIGDFNDMLGLEDSFFFYFSGHGLERNLIFSDGQVELQSIIDFIDKLPAKNKIVVLDCCHSGGFKSRGPSLMHFEDEMDAFAGRGIAVLASSASDEASRISKNGRFSLLSDILAGVLISIRPEKGRISLNEIQRKCRLEIESWNKIYSDKQQHPIFRSSIGGDLWFTIEKYKGYKTATKSFEREGYSLKSVKPLSTGTQKRLAAFIILDSDYDDEMLAHITNDVAKNIKYAEVYGSKQSELIHEGTLAKAIWCYFGKDETDIINSLHFAYTIWAIDEEYRNRYFKPSKNAVIKDGVFIFTNTSYDTLKKIYIPSNNPKEFISDNRELLATIVNMAERFLFDMQEVENRSISEENFQDQYGKWIGIVRKKYIELSDGEIPPNDLHEWSDAIMDLAGWVVDLSIHFERIKREGFAKESDRYLMELAKKRYYESIERIKEIEKQTKL